MTGTAVALARSSVAVVGLLLPVTLSPHRLVTLSSSRLVVSRLSLGHVLGRVLGPGGVAVSVADDHLSRQAGAQQRPALIFFDPDANGHTLNDLGELAGNDVARQQRELRSGRFVHPDDPARKRPVEGVKPQLDRVARRDPA